MGEYGCPIPRNGTDFHEVSDYRIKRIQHLMNGRPHKVIGWKKPYEAMQELLQ